MPIATQTRSRRTAPDIAKLPAEALITRHQLAELTGFAHVTLRVWAREGRGPKVTTVEGYPRYRVHDVRAWIGATGAA